MSIPESVPRELIAGDTWRWTRELANYPAPTWDLTVYFENHDGTFNATATDSGTGHAFSVDAATTAGYRAGRYRWRLRATDGTNYESVESGWTEVLPDPASAGKREVRSDERIMLDNIKEFLREPSSIRAQAHTIGGRSMARIPLAELMQVKKDLEQAVRIQEQGASAGLGRNIKVRLRRA